ncbi:MAG: DinB family protein [Anaerolineae bacterium]|nr:DinB family protein [Anaerolineae bacterium]
MIDFAQCIDQFSQQAEILRLLAAGIGPDQARWKPDPESWSILEVINHLADEEHEDFRTRLKHILDQVEGLPPNIDPQGWVTARGYNQRDLSESLSRFLAAREESLAWLRTLGSPDWTVRIETPFGGLSAGDMLMAWLAHDLLHQRQLIELRYLYLRQNADPFHVGYAGDW